MVRNTIKKNRARLNMTQADLANALKTDDHTSLTLSVIESGKALPTRPYLEALCEALDRDALELYRPEDLDLMGLVRQPDRVCGAGRRKRRRRGGHQMHVRIPPRHAGDTACGLRRGHEKPRDQDSPPIWTSTPEVRETAFRGSEGRIQNLPALPSDNERYT